MTTQAPTKKTASLTSSKLRVARMLTALAILLALVASAGGLFLPGLYRDTAWVVPQNRGTDLVTLGLALPALAVALLAARRGSPRATLVWIGLLGYLFYVYTGAAFAYAFNEFFLLYVALFSLSVFALAAAATGLDVAALEAGFRTSTPRRPVAVFLLFIALMLCALWLGQILPFFTTGTVPESVTLSGGPTFFVYVLDLGLIVPLAVLGAIWLWRRLPWGYVLAGVILIKAAAMGLALLAMTWFATRAGIVAEVELTATYLVIAAGGLGFSGWFLYHLGGNDPLLTRGR